MAKKEKEREPGIYRVSYFSTLRFSEPCALRSFPAFYFFSSSLPRGLARVVVAAVVASEEEGKEEAEDLGVFDFQLPSYNELSLAQRSEL
jgi:hypothetical protein